jgi:hypothetical protein
LGYDDQQQDEQVEVNEVTAERPSARSRSS